jgi:hypothetical protein
MILTWNNKNSFKQHLDEMKTFRETHKNQQTEQLNDMPLLVAVKPPQETGLIKSLTDDNENVIFITMKKITLTRGTNN